MLLTTAITITYGDNVKADNGDNFDIYVDDDADPSWYDSTHVKTIQEGIDNASNSDTIYVYSGIYQENIVIKESLTIIGEEKNITIIDGCKNNYVVQIFANDTKISDFTIQNSSENGINIVGSGNIVDNNVLENNGYLGMSMKNSTHATISNNIIRYNKRGVCLCLCCFNTTILNNSIENNYHCGLYIYKSCNNHIFKNNFEKNKCGIIISRSHNNTFYLNTICSCKRCSLNLYRSSNNTITRNNFLKSIICAFFTCCDNHWDDNYWNKPRIFPKTIIGIKEGKLIRPGIEFDWHPAREICC